MTQPDKAFSSRKNIRNQSYNVQLVNINGNARDGDCDSIAFVSVTVTVTKRLGLNSSLRLEPSQLN